MYIPFALLTCFLSLYCYLYVEGSTTVIPIFSEEINNSDMEPIGLENEKQSLRYGLHKVADCKKYEYVYVCIRKCLDLNYDVAHMDRHCKCTCFTKTEKGQFLNQNKTFTKKTWMSGAPTTKRPRWATEATTVAQDSEETSTPAHNATSSNDTAGNGTAGNGTSGNETTRNGTAGNGTDGNGTAGNGTAGNGTAGNDTAGNATSGTNTTGNGTDPAANGSSG